MNHEQAEHVIGLLSQTLEELKTIRIFLMN